MTTIVPPSCTARPSPDRSADEHRAHRRVVGLGKRDVVHLGPVEERVGAARRAVDELIHHHELARMDVRLQRPAAHGATIGSHSELRIAHTLAR